MRHVSSSEAQHTEQEGGELQDEGKQLLRCGDTTVDDVAVGVLARRAFNTVRNKQPEPAPDGTQPRKTRYFQLSAVRGWTDAVGQQGWGGRLDGVGAAGFGMRAVIARIVVVHPLYGSTNLQHTECMGMHVDTCDAA
jgi:hypothetical protein